MAPPNLPSSLSPHVCILASPDVQDVLERASLPPLPEILQCFSPLPQSKCSYLVYEVPHMRGVHGLLIILYSHHQNHVINVGSACVLCFALLGRRRDRRRRPRG